MPRKSKLPPGFYSRNGILYLSYWDKLTQRPKLVSSKILDHPDNYKLAREWKEEFLKQNKKARENFILDQHKMTASGVENIEQAAEEYGVVKSLSDKSKEALRYSVGHWIQSAGNKNIAKYTQRDYHQFLLYMKARELSNQSQAFITRTLYALMNYYVRRKMITENIITVVKPVNKKPEAIPLEDMKLILHALREKNLPAYNFCMFLYLSGFRIGEAVRLVWSDVDFEKGLIYVQNHKAKRRDVLPLLDDLANHLKTIPVTESNKVFPMYNSTEGLKFFNRIQEEIWGKGNQHYTLHQFRKTFVTKLIAEGVHMFHIKTLARHSDIRTTLEYYAEENVNNLRRELEGKVNFGREEL